MILFRVFLLVLVISLAYSMPADSKNKKGETADKGQVEDGKEEDKKETNHKVFLKEYGDKDKKFKEKGYNRKSEDVGDDGYKHFDSYHKKNSDRYGYESHSAYGKLKKGGAHGGDADIKYEDKDSHEAAASRRVLHIVSPWHDTEFLPHFDIERIASKFYKHSPSDHEYIHDHHPGYFDHHDIHYDTEYSDHHIHHRPHYHEYDHPHFHESDHHPQGYDHPPPDHKDDHYPHEYDQPPPDHNDDHHPHEYDHPPPDHKDDHHNHDYEFPPPDKDGDAEYDHHPGHHEHDHHDEYDHIPKTDGYKYDHPPDGHKVQYDYDHISVDTSSGDIDQSYDQKNSQHEYDHPPPGYDGHDKRGDKSSNGSDQKDTHQYGGSHLEYDHPPPGYNGHEQNHSPNNGYDQAPNNKEDQGEDDRPPPGYGYGNPTVQNNGGSDTIVGNNYERKDTQAPNFFTVGFTGTNHKKVQESKPNNNHKYLNNIRIYFGGTYTPYLNGQKLNSWNNDTHGLQNKSIENAKIDGALFGGPAKKIHENMDNPESKEGNIGIVGDNSYDIHNNNVPDHSLPEKENIANGDTTNEAVTYGSPNNNNSEHDVTTSGQQNSGIFIGNSYMPEDQIKSDDDSHLNNGDVHDTSLEDKKDESPKNVDIPLAGSLNVNSQNYNYDIHEANYPGKAKKLDHRIDDDSFNGLIMPIAEKTQEHLNHNQQTNYDTSYSIVNQNDQNSPDTKINDDLHNNKTYLSGSFNHGDLDANSPIDQHNVQVHSKEDNRSSEIKQEIPSKHSKTIEENQEAHFSSAPNTVDNKNHHSELKADDIQRVYNNNESDQNNQQNVNDNEKGLHNIALNSMQQDVHITDTEYNNNRNFDSKDDILQNDNNRKPKDDTHLATKFTIFIPDDRKGYENFNYNNEPLYAAPVNPANHQIANTPISTSGDQQNADNNLPGSTDFVDQTDGNTSNHETLAQFVPNMNKGVSNQDQQHFGYHDMEPQQSIHELYSGPEFSPSINKINYDKRHSDERSRNGRETFAYMSNPADQKISIKRDNKSNQKQPLSADLGTTHKRNSNQADTGIYFTGTFNPDLGKQNDYLRQRNYKHESVNKDTDQKEMHSKNENSASLNPRGIYVSRLFNSNYQENHNNNYAHNDYPEGLRNDGILPIEAYNYINNSYYGNSQPRNNVKGGSETAKRTGDNRKTLADNRSSDISANKRKTI